MNERKLLTVAQKLNHTKSVKKYFIKVVLTLMIILMSGATVEAASSLKLYYNKKTVNYTGQKVTYKYNSKAINNSARPGIIMNGTSLVSAYDVFTNKAIGAKYSYSSKSGVVTIKKDTKEVKMTVGSKTAYVNGVKKTTSLAPLLVKYPAGSSKVLVPARFVFESLGYTYNWQSNISTVTITSPVKSSATKGLNLYYDNKWVNYTSTQGIVMINGKKLPLTMPSIIINNTAMVHAWRVFSYSSIKAAYNYNSSTGTVTLKKGDKEIVMTLGSKKALVNGVEKTMSEAPRLVKSKERNASYVMVPGQSVTNFLGYGYKWNGTSKASEINTKVTNTDPELDGDDTSPLNPEKTYVKHSISPSMEVEFNSVKGINKTNIPGTNYNTSSILSVWQDGSSYTNKDVYVITLSSPLGEITSSFKNDSTISVTLANTAASNNTYIMNDGLASQILTNYDPANNNTTLDISLNAPKAKYELNLSNDLCTLYVNVYNNYISELEAGYKSGNDTIAISSLSKLAPIITEDSTHVYLDFKNTINGIGTKSDQISDGIFMKEITVTNPTYDTTRISIVKTSGSNYVTSSTDNKYTISFYDETVSNYSLMIKKPSGIDASQITNEDLYYNNQFKITLPGDQTQFLAENPIINTNSVITSVTYSLNQNGNTDILVKTKKLQGYKVSVQNDSIKVAVGNPKDIYKNIVILDAGHGGHDPGAQYGGYSEKNINYKILYTCAKKYFNSSDSNIKAYWTRRDDTFITLDDRAAYAKKMGADLFISLHMNAAGSKTPEGLEVYYSSSNSSVSDSGLTSSKFATIFASQLSTKLDLINRGAKNSAFVVVKKNTVPAILIELGFMTNSNDLNKMKSATFQDKTAKAIYESAAYVFDNYPTGR